MILKNQGFVCINNNTDLYIIDNWENVNIKNVSEINDNFKQSTIIKCNNFFILFKII